MGLTRKEFKRFTLGEMSNSIEPVKLASGERQFLL